MRDRKVGTSRHLRTRQARHDPQGWPTKRLLGVIHKAIESARMEHDVYMAALRQETRIMTGCDLLEAKTTYIVPEDEDNDDVEVY